MSKANSVNPSCKLLHKSLIKYVKRKIAYYVRKNDYYRAQLWRNYKRELEESIHNLEQELTNINKLAP